MRARAFQEWAQAELSHDLSVQLHRPLEKSHAVYAFGVWLYNWIQRNAPFAHHAYFNFLEVVPIVRTRRPLGAKKYRKVLEDLQPDVLISVHDSLNHGFFEYARDVFGRDRVKCITYCGELSGGYGFSRHWVNPSADLFIGAVPETCQAAVRCGMPPERTRVGGFLLRRFFYDKPESDAGRAAFIRERLRLDPDEFILLLSASSRGAHNHVRFLDALRRRRVDAQVVLLCGKSPIAEREVSKWARANPTARVRLLPHNTNVGQLMRSVSAIVARPGTGTTSEAIVSGCPLLLNSLGGIMPQERITVRFSRDHGVAQLVRSPEELAGIVTEWRRRPELPAAIRRAMQRARPPFHPSDIVRTIAALGVRAGSISEGRIPVVEAARAARPAAPTAPGIDLPRPAPVADSAS
ncbi:MAG TPA: glycosyltransferase [Verrucomicrobiae bacterium]|nr:glycosyltransferase [Verrucomicrobiae bacterium]